MLQDYWSVMKWFFIAVFVITAVQASLISLDFYTPPALDPFGISKVLMVVGFAWSATRRSGFTFQQVFIGSILLFIPTFAFVVVGFLGPDLPPDMGTVLKVLSLFVFTTINFILYGVIGLITALIAGRKTSA